MELVVAVSPATHPPIRRAFGHARRVSRVRDSPTLLEHTTNEQTTLDRGELGVTVQLHGISLELEASAPPVSKETRTDERQ
jgi:hypothetical protein